MLLNVKTKLRDYNKNFLAWVQCIQLLGWQHVTIFIGTKCTEFTIHLKKKKGMRDRGREKIMLKDLELLVKSVNETTHQT